MFTLDSIQKRLSKKEIADPLVDKFVRYVKFETTSSSFAENGKKPSTDTQFELAKILEKELKELGLETSLDEHCFVFGDLKASEGYENKESILLMAHIDTSEACSGKDVKPTFHENYDGKELVIGNGISISPKDTPALTNCVGDTLITSDGSTLLGADDKAGIANIMTCLEYIIKNNIKHGPIQVVFNADEEIGCGVDYFPMEKVHSKLAITIDSGEAPSIEAQCFNAFTSNITFKGFSVHPGYARGKMVNAAVMAAQFVQMIPRTESPEATDEDYGYFNVASINGTTEEASVTVRIRDFDIKVAEQRVERLNTLAKAVEAIFPGGQVTVKTSLSYKNMLDGMGPDSKALNLLKAATKKVLGSYQENKIRGGTDGALLTNKGLPTPNMFTGGNNWHSRSEYAAVSQMVAAVEVLIEIIQSLAQ